MKKTWSCILFIFVFFTTLGPFVPYTQLLGNLSWVDVFIIIFPLIILKKITLPLISLLPMSLAAMSLASVAYSIDDYSSMYVFGYISRWIFFAIIIILIPNVIKTKQQVHLCLVAILVSAVFTSFWAWFAWFQSPRYFGNIPMLHLIHEESLYEINRNYLGFFSSVGMCVAYGLIRSTPKNAKFISYLFLNFCLICMLVTVAFSFSKGAWFSVFMAILVFECHRFFYSNYTSKVYYLLNVIFLFLGSFFLFILFSEAWIFDYLSSVETAIRKSNETNTERLNYAIQALILTLENPVLGVGPKNYEIAAGRAGFLETPDPHNAILWVGAELGIFGSLISVFLFLWLLSKVLFAIHRSIYVSEYVPIYMLTLCLIFNIPLHGLPVSSKYLWIAIALVVSLCRINNQRAKVITSTEVK